MLNRWLILIFCFFATSVTVSAETSSQTWAAMSVDLPIIQDSSQYRLYLEGQPRYNFSEHRIEKVYLNSALGYRLSPQLTLWVGYLWATTGYRLADGDRLVETRFWQQINYSQKYHDLTIAHRLRLEERDVEDDPHSAERLRYQLRASHPLFDYQNKVIGITCFDEVAYNLPTSSAQTQSGWYRNRAFLGPYLTYQKLRWELGYLNERIQIDDKWNRNNHILLTSLSFVY